MSTTPDELATPSVIFDFDGTLSLGRGPLLAYARSAAAAILRREPSTEATAEAAPRIPAGSTKAHVPADGEESAAAYAALDGLERGETTYRDGYDAVGSLAADVGLSQADLGAAYLASRAVLGTDEAPVTTMPGLDEFLSDLGTRARVLLATNAPEPGVDRVLAAWGVRGRFDELHFDVGKPAGLTALIRAEQQTGPVLVVGDVVDIDLAPAIALHADTALVGATAPHATAAVTMRAATLNDLRSEIESWVAATASSLPSPAGAHPTTERQ
ncbi:MAG: HAD family hydrolase [Pseudoclavibacter sp.]